MAHLWGEWLRLTVVMAVVVGLPRLHRRIGTRATAWVAAAAIVATTVWTKLRYDEAIISWRTLALIAAVAVMYLVSMPTRDDDEPSSASSPSTTPT